jgi:MoaA/NifB/PqqE/SkfB family radical SAM enzyme
VQLSGHGETFMHPRFMEMLDAVIDAGCRVTFQTNGTILKRAQIERLVRPEIEEVTISIDGATPEVFEKIRRRAKLERVLDNIRFLQDTKRRLGVERPELVLEFVAMRQNIHELPAVVRLAGELGIKKLLVAELKEYNLTRGQSLAGDPLMAQFALEAEAEAAKWGIWMSLPPHIPGREVEKAAEPPATVEAPRVPDDIVPASRLTRPDRESNPFRGFRKD